MKNKFRNFLKENKNKITLNIGEITIGKLLGEGANGLVYSGEIFDQEFAFKFLLSETTGATKDKKIQRFLAEYFNIKQLNDNNLIVKYIDYDTLEITDADGDYEVPIIIMKKYLGALESLNMIDDLEEQAKQFENIFTFLLDSIEIIHNGGVIHRDIKPENILKSEKCYVLADFGIASYNPEQFKILAETKKSERIGNRLFSAPEQENPGIKANCTMDIYAIGQILHWLIFNETHKGTNRKNISSVNPSLSLYDLIIDKCLSNNPEQRFQSILEIRTFIDGYQRPERDLWYYLYQFDSLLVESFPKNEYGIVYSEDTTRIDYLFGLMKERENIFIKNIDFMDVKLIWWHDGSRNTSFKLTSKVIVIENLHLVPFGFKKGKSSAWSFFDLQSAWESCKDRKETII